MGKYKILARRAFSAVNIEGGRMSLTFFKALADETRLRLAHILFQYELSVNELAHIMDIGQSRVSRHLKILTEASLLRSRRDGLWVFYSVPPAGTGLEFLKAIMPFFPANAQMENDLKLAAQILEERSRKARQFFNAIAEDWDNLNHEVLQDFDLPACVVQAVPPRCNVAVDLGCGTGEVLKSLQGLAKTLVGVDGSARMLDLCRSRIGAAELANGDVSLRIGELSHLPLADGEADFACINLVLHHLARPLDIFSEIQRIMAPGGTLFVADFLAHNDESMRASYGDHWLGFELGDIQQALYKNGFDPCEPLLRPVGKNLRIFMIKARQVSRNHK